MGADSNIKVAAGQLRSAAGTLHAQVNSLRSDHERSKGHHNSEVSRLEMEAKLHESTAGVSGNDSEKAASLAVAQEMRKQVDQHKQALKTEEQQIGQLLQAKDNLAQQLESLAKQLDSLAGNGAAS